MVLQREAVQLRRQRLRSYMLLTGNIKRSITIETPKGILYNAEILDIRRAEKEVSCAVEKDGGDDPDITTGAWIYVKVSYPEYAQEVSSFGNRRNWEGQNGEGCEKNTEDFITTYADGIAIDEEYFPDENFRKYLKDNFDEMVMDISVRMKWIV